MLFEALTDIKQLKQVENMNETGCKDLRVNRNKLTNL
jgi:hypothetical protein